jgi:prolyl 4-hydroxylase
VLEPQWHQWIRENLDRGCTVKSLVDAMAVQQIERGLAIATIQHVMALPASAAAAPGASSPLRYWPPGFPFLDANTMRLDGREIRLLSRLDTPAVAVLDGVLSDDECEQLIDLSRSKLARSTVVDPERGAETTTLERDSEGMYFQRGENPLVSTIEARLAQIMCSPVVHGEGLQVLHYGPGGEYRPHLDYFDPVLPGSAVHQVSGGQRTATLILYLNDVDDGGETVFPQAGLRCVPRRGMGLYFAYAAADGQLDPLTLHGGAPVRRGDKWIATKWVRERPYG